MTDRLSDRQTDRRNRLSSRVHATDKKLVCPNNIQALRGAKEGKEARSAEISQLVNKMVKKGEMINRKEHFSRLNHQEAEPPGWSSRTVLFRARLKKYIQQGRIHGQ